MCSSGNLPRSPLSAFFLAFSGFSHRYTYARVPCVCQPGIAHANLNCRTDEPASKITPYRHLPILDLGKLSRSMHYNPVIQSPCRVRFQLASERCTDPGKESWRQRCTGCYSKSWKRPCGSVPVPQRRLLPRAVQSNLSGLEFGLRQPVLPRMAKFGKNLWGFRHT